MKQWVLAVARAGQGDAEIGTDASRVLAQHHDAVGQQHGFLDVVRHDEDGARGHLVALPEFHQLAAQVFGGEHIERRERLVHEEHLRLDHQCAREADALFHAAGQLLRVGVFETVEPHRIENTHAALDTLGGGNAPRLEWRSHILDHRQPREQREALKHD